MDKRLIKEAIKEMIDAGEIEITLKTISYPCDFREGITIFDVKSTIEDVDVLIEVDLREKINES